MMWKGLWLSKPFCTSVFTGKAYSQTAMSLSKLRERERLPAVGEQQVRDYIKKLDVFKSGGIWHIPKAARRAGWCDCQVAINYEMRWLGWSLMTGKRWMLCLSLRKAAEVPLRCPEGWCDSSLWLGILVVGSNITEPECFQWCWKTHSEEQGPKIALKGLGWTSKNIFHQAALGQVT